MHLITRWWYKNKRDLDRASTESNHRSQNRISRDRIARSSSETLSPFSPLFLFLTQLLTTFREMRANRQAGRQAVNSRVESTRELLTLDRARSLRSRVKICARMYVCIARSGAARRRRRRRRREAKEGRRALARRTKRRYIQWCERARSFAVETG